MAPRVFVALLAASGMVWTTTTATTVTHTMTTTPRTTTTATTMTGTMTTTSPTTTTVTTMTHTITSASDTGTTTTASLTATSNTETSSTASSTQTITVSLATGTTSSITTFTLVACSGDAETWDAGFGNCSTYAHGARAPLLNYYYYDSNYNYYYCSSDSDLRDGVLAQHACPECGRCFLTTTTTSAHSTTGTSTGTSTTSLHSTTDTSTSSTPHTTTGTTGTTVTQGPCTRAWYAQFELETGRDLPCTPVNGTCPMDCRAVYENAIVACDGTSETWDGYYFYPQPAGAVVSRSLGSPVSQGVCKEEVAEALLSNVEYTPTCLDGLWVLSTEIDFCQADDNLTACPELCERIMDVAFDSCTANDTIYFGHLAVTAEELVESHHDYFQWSPQCTALLRSRTFRGGLASKPPEELVPASTTADHSSSMKTSSGGTTMGMNSSGTGMGMSSTGTSGGMSDAAQGEEEITSSSYTSAGSLLLLCWSASLLAMM